MWVFGYGSLIWNPGFPSRRRQIARLRGYARRFCMWSIHHRGTPDSPGLVLALDRQPGALCLGLALEVAPGHEAATLAYLRRRELVSAAYLEQLVPVELDGGGRIEALTYVVDPTHAQYCAALSFEAQARIIARARGGRGPNRDYLFSTARHLAALGIADPELERLAGRVRQMIDDKGE